jgi:hypothetical protein
MNEIVNHKAISFFWPFGPRDSSSAGKPIMLHLGRYRGFAVRQGSLADSVNVGALYQGHPSKG